MPIIAGQLLLNDHGPVSRVALGFVRVESGVIVEVVEGEVPVSADWGGPNCLVSPGFIDAHLHLPQFDMIGAHGMSLLDWLDDVTFPAEMKWADTDFARSMCRRVLRQCLGFGTTGICAYATSHHDATMAALDEASRLGMRGVIGQVLMDRNAPRALCGEVDEQIEQAAATLEVYPPSGRLAAAVTPRFAVACTPELLMAAGKLASEQDAMIQTHLAETQRECDLIGRLFDGTRYVDVYQQNRLLTSKSILGHGIYLSAADRRVLAEAGSVVAHCPTANSFLRSGAMDRSGHLGDGITVALGSDIGAGYERSMVRVARAMIQTAAGVGDAFPTAAEAWYQITAGNADALGWPKAGRLAVGHPADLLVIEPDIDWVRKETKGEVPTSRVCPLSMLMFAWDDRWLKQTMVRGECLAASS